MRESPVRARSRVAATAAVLDALRRIVRVLRVANSGVEKVTGLSAAQLYVLEQVAAAPGSSLSELATRTLTDRTSVAAVVERLVARDLVARRRSETDRRRVEIAPTEAGRAVLTRAPHPPTRQLLDGLESLDDAELRRLATGLGRLVHEMGISDEPVVMLFEDDVPQRDAAAEDDLAED
jgi:DNA-binding MarR family transcriptional regulator